MNIKEALNKYHDDKIWQNVPEEAVRLASLSLSTYTHIKTANLPEQEDNYRKFWYHPYEQILFFNIGKDKDLIKLSSYKNSLQNTPNVKYLEYDWTGTPDLSREPWVQFRFNTHSNFFKKAEEDKGIQPFSSIAQATGYKEGPVTDIIGGPNPISAGIASGILGAGLGYGTGAALEHLFPERYVERGRARKTLGLLGLGAGVGVPAWWAWARHRSGQDPFKVAAALDLVVDADCDVNEEFNKLADSFNSIDYQPMIDSDYFNKLVWSPMDKTTPSSLRAMASGLVTGASAVRNTSDVSPMDIARVAKGGLYGLAFGRAAGALVGLKPEYQDKLMEMGAWTGVLKTSLPKAL